MISTPFAAMTLVVDSAAVIAALIQADIDGDWARQTLASDDIATCHHLPLEVINVLRRRELAGELSAGFAGMAQAELRAMSFDLHTFLPFGERIWELRHAVAVADAWYVALAERLDAPLVTLDRRLIRAPGLRCQFLTP